MFGAGRADGDQLLSFLKAELGGDPAHGYLNDIVPVKAETVDKKAEEEDSPLEEGEMDL
jgi:hypothetical protein